MTFIRGEISAFIEYDPLAHLPLGERQNSHDQEEQDRKRRTVAEEVKLEGLLVEVIDEHRRRETRTALRQHRDLREDLQRSDDGNNRSQKDSRADQRQGNA